jgi:hypothetical protein
VVGGCEISGTAGPWAPKQRRAPCGSPQPLAKLKPAHLTHRKAGGSAIQDHPRVAALPPLNAVEGPVPVVPAGARGIDQDLIPNLQLRIMQVLHSHHTRKSVPPGWKL